MMQTKEPLVSIVVPAYNSGRYLTETIDSVINQTYKNWELLIVDDGSSDDTLSIAAKFASRDPRVKVFPSESNWGGPAKPRNFGIRQAKGDYIAFLDSDDLWLPGKLQKQIDFLEKNKDIFWLYSKFIIKKNGRHLKLEPVKPKSGYIFHDLLISFNLVPILTVVIRNKKEANRYFFDEEKKFVAVEDYGMWMDIAKDEKISFIDEPLAIYRVHSNGISSGAYLNFKKCGPLLRKFDSYAPRSVIVRSRFNYYRRLMVLGMIDLYLLLRGRLRGYK